MKAVVEEIEVKGKKIQKGTNIVLNFEKRDDWGDMHLTVTNMYIDGQKDEFDETIIWVECITNFGHTSTYAYSQIESALKTK